MSFPSSCRARRPADVFQWILCRGLLETCVEQYGEQNTPMGSRLVGVQYRAAVPLLLIASPLAPLSPFFFSLSISPLLFPDVVMSAGDDVAPAVLGSRRGKAQLSITHNNLSRQHLPPPPSLRWHLDTSLPSASLPFGRTLATMV